MDTYVYYNIRNLHDHASHASEMTVSAYDLNAQFDGTVTPSMSDDFNRKYRRLYRNLYL